MAFKVRFSGFFMTQLLLILAFLCLASWDFFSPQYNQGFLHYKYIIYVVAALPWIVQIYRPICSVIINKPILTVNDDYIYDFNYDIKYFWKDIEEIYEKRGYLYINLYHPEDYLNKIGNAHRRFVAKLWFKLNRETSLFVINKDIIDVDGHKLLEILDGYSMKAIGDQNP